MFLVPALQNGAFGFYKSVYRLPYPFRVLILPSDFNYTRRFLAENNGNLCIRVWTLLIYQKYNIFRHIDKFCMYAYCLCRSNVFHRSLWMAPSVYFIGKGYDIRMSIRDFKWPWLNRLNNNRLKVIDPFLLVSKNKVSSFGLNPKCWPNDQ